MDPFGHQDPMEDVLSLQSYPSDSEQGMQYTDNCNFTVSCGDTFNCGFTGACGDTVSCSATVSCGADGAVNK